MEYKTKQRETILNMLKNSEGSQLSAEELFIKLRLNGSNIGKSTVYRYLEALVEQGAVRKFLADDGKSSNFQFIGSNKDCSSHCHMKCSACGAFLHIECSLFDMLGEHIIAEHSFEMDFEKTVIYGLCRNCREGKNII